MVSINELRFRTQDELTRSLQYSGFVVENVYGDWDSSPASTKSQELIFVATKANKVS